MSLVNYTLTTENIEKFRDFLEKFKKVSQSLLIEVWPEMIASKTYTPDRGFIKRSQLDMEAFNASFDETPPAVIKVPFFNIDRVMKNIDLLPDGNIDIVFVCEKQKPNSNGILCSQVKFVSETLTIINACTEIDYVMSLSDSVYDGIIKSAEKGVQTTIHKAQMKKVTSLFDIDSAEKTVSIRMDEGTGKIHVFNSLYDYQLPDEVVGTLERPIRVKKEFLSYIGDDTTKLNITEDKVITYSTESNTTSIIGVVNED
jgi:hypothetical protein